MFTTQISTGFIVGTIIVAIILAALTIIGWGGFWYFRHYDDVGQQDNVMAWGTLIGSAVVAIIVIVIAGFIDFPFSAQYHEYRPVTGHVQGVGSRFLSDGSSTTQNFAVILNGQTYRCDDTRCSDLKIGDPLTLLCIRDFQFNATSGWDCNWGKEAINR